MLLFPTRRIRMRFFTTPGYLRGYPYGAQPVYRMAAELLDVAPGQVLMVAAHRWDLDGARSAGLRTAFVERPAEKGPHGVADRAADTVSDVATTSFVDLAELLGC
jgi:2-haloacid dehalogenase